ncbi:hypothetical protein N9N67_11785 [Bacteriovoracaceae bacterium]|nr:hypothetical protein [Bacteriovoracaceae bacterium]
MKLFVYAGKDDAISSPDLFKEISDHPKVELEIQEGGHGSFHTPEFFQKLKLAK